MNGSEFLQKLNQKGAQENAHEAVPSTPQNNLTLNKIKSKLKTFGIGLTAFILTITVALSLLGSSDLEKLHEEELKIEAQIGQKLVIEKSLQDELKRVQDELDDLREQREKIVSKRNSLIHGIIPTAQASAEINIAEEVGGTFNQEYIIVHHTVGNNTFDQINESHRKRGFPQSSTGYYVGYHYLINKDGSFKQSHPENEAGYHASSNGMNNKSIGISLVGNFNNEYPTKAQAETAYKLITEVQAKYSIPDEKVIGHKDVAKTACPGKNLYPPLQKIKEYKDMQKKDLGNWRITTYYTPVKEQAKYWNGSYEKDFKINCSGDCFVTASGHRLTNEDESKVVACPSTFAFGTKFWITNVGYVTCEDRGGAIKGKRLDLWVGSGDRGFSNVGKGSSKSAQVIQIN